MDRQTQELPESGIRFDESTAAEAHAWLLKVQQDTAQRSPASLLSKCFKPEATAQVVFLHAASLLRKCFWQAHLFGLSLCYAPGSDFLGG